MFICQYGVKALLFGNVNWAEVQGSNEPHELSLFGSHAHSLVGILCGGFYLHNISLPIIRNAQNPENNLRDVFLGFLLVFISYVACGTLGYIGFSNEEIFS